MGAPRRLHAMAAVHAGGDDQPPAGAAGRLASAASAAIIPENILLWTGRSPYQYASPGTPRGAK